MLIYRIKNKDNNKIYASILDKQRALDRLFEADQGVYKRCGWPKGEYMIEIVSLEQEKFDNKQIF
jgi:hypothetical protein